jgi:class 3 adenylate cyclase/HAMP domain-containing protein
MLTDNFIDVTNISSGLKVLKIENTRRIDMKISLRIIILLGFLLILTPALLLLSYTDYSKAKTDLENNFNFMIDQTAENVTGAYDLVEVGFRILSLSLENQMLSAFEPFKAAYFEVNGEVSKIDLAELKEELGDEVDLYIIDEHGVIIHTTFEKDLNLDFSKVAPGFNKKLQEIRMESRYQGDRISNETVTGNVRKYAYWGTPDKKYILEIGIKSSQFEGPLKNLDLLKISSDFEQFNPDLKSVIIFNGNGKVANKPDFAVTEDQESNIVDVYESGERLDIDRVEASEKWIYVKADIDEADGSASQGDKVIELVFDTSTLKNQLSELALNQALITVFFIVAGGIMSLILANRISKPITAITEAVGVISKGELNIEIKKQESSKELSDLSSGISQMKDSIKDRINDIQIINSSYERFVPKEFLTLLEKKSIMDVSIGDSTSLKMSVLFSDMRDFTSISENMSPKENFDFLNNYLDSMTPAINKNNGFIDKYIGDAVMALFPTSAEDSVKAALEMNKELRNFNSVRTAGGRETVNMGVGIHIGQLVLGTIGRETRMETTVISDTVNASARLESLNKTYGTNVLISGDVRNELSTETQKSCRLVDRTQVKGKSEFLDVYEVLSSDDTEVLEAQFSSIKTLEQVVTNFLDGDKKAAGAEFSKIKNLTSLDPVISYWDKRLKIG